MKFILKILLIFVLQIVISKSLYSQKLFGISGGLSENNFRTRNYDFSIKYKTKNSLNISAFIKAKKSKHYWLGFETIFKSIYIDLETTYKGQGGSAFSKSTCNLGYIYFCFNNEFRFGEKYSFYFSFNPFFGLKVFDDGNGTTSSYTMNHYPTYSNIDNPGDLFKNESGLITKCGYDMLITDTFRVLAEIGYNIGLTSIYNNSSFSIKTSGVFVKLGIAYQLN